MAVLTLSTLWHSDCFKFKEDMGQVWRQAKDIYGGPKYFLFVCFVCLVSLLGNHLFYILKTSSSGTASQN